MVTFPSLSSIAQVTFSTCIGAGTASFWAARNTQVLSIKDAAIISGAYGAATSLARVAIGQDESYAKKIVAFLLSSGLTTYLLLKSAPLLLSRYNLFIPELPHLIPLIALNALGQFIVFFLIPSGIKPPKTIADTLKLSDAQLQALIPKTSEPSPLVQFVLHLKELMPNFSENTLTPEMIKKWTYKELEFIKDKKFQFQGSLLQQAFIVRQFELGFFDVRQLSKEDAQYIATFFEQIGEIISKPIALCLFICFYDFSIPPNPAICAKIASIKSDIQPLELFKIDPSNSLSSEQILWHSAIYDLGFGFEYPLKTQIFLRQLSPRNCHYHLSSLQVNQATKDDIAVLFTGPTNWVQLTREWQMNLITRFRNAFPFPPCHPTFASEVNGLSIEHLQAYHQNFNPQRIHDVTSGYSILQAFHSRFSHHKLDLLKTIDLTTSEKFDNDQIEWIKLIFAVKTPETHAMWSELSFFEQYKLKSQVNIDFNYRLTNDQLLLQMTHEHLTALHVAYQNNPIPWVTFTSNLLSKLNKSFIATNLPQLNREEGIKKLNEDARKSISNVLSSETMWSSMSDEDQEIWIKTGLKK